MKIKKEVTFTFTEVEEITHEAVKYAAILVLGPAQEDEEWEINLSDYGESRATLKKKPVQQKTEEDKETI